MDLNTIGVFAAISGVLISIIVIAYHFGRIVERTNNNLTDLRESHQDLKGQFERTTEKHGYHLEKIPEIVKDLEWIKKFFFRDKSDSTLPLLLKPQSESYLISSRGEAIIPNEIKELIRTFVERNKNLCGKPVHEITAAFASVEDFERIWDKVIDELPKKIERPGDLAFGLITAYVGYVAAGTLIKEAYELLDRGDEGMAMSKIAKAVKHYEKIGEINRATETHIDFAKKLFDRDNYGWSKSQYYHGVIILMKNNFLEEAAEIMEEAGKRFEELPYGEEKHRAERFFECASSFRKAADHIAKGEISDAIEIIKKLCKEFDKRNRDWGKSCYELVSKLM